MRTTRATPPLFALLLAAAVAACVGADFDPPSLLKTVRILGSRADKPYAKPGEPVTVEVLAYDARKEKPEPMQIFWIPFVCENPPGDLYYACFAAFGGAAPPSAVANGKPLPSLPPALANALKPGIDLSPLLPKGPTYTFTMPADVVSSHPKVPGASAPYGMVVLFNMVCAGHVEIVERDANDPQSAPVGCFDHDGKQLGADESGIGFTRVYAYDQRTNQNPVIARVLFDGKPVDLAQGIPFAHCTSANVGDCPHPKLDVDVPDASDEVNEGDLDPQSGQPRKEEIWASWFVTEGAGAISKNETELLYEPRLGRITSDNEAEYRPPSAVGEGLLFVVVHDNRGGASWAQVPVHVQ